MELSSCKYFCWTYLPKRVRLVRFPLREPTLGERENNGHSWTLLLFAGSSFLHIPPNHLAVFEITASLDINHAGHRHSAHNCFMGSDNGGDDQSSTHKIIADRIGSGNHQRDGYHRLRRPGGRKNGHIPDYSRDIRRNLRPHCRFFLAPSWRALHGQKGHWIYPHGHRRFSPQVVTSRSLHPRRSFFIIRSLILC